MFSDELPFSSTLALSINNFNLFSKYGSLLHTNLFSKNIKASAIKLADLILTSPLNLARGKSLLEFSRIVGYHFAS